ncbi:hypothetical protein OC846_003968 [Tilletia horrida]|uniref:NADAR domain-containing protein n=1 Tax=Tilletia horrida TaxID=155126 RepID=A0AAN6GPJ2_9BASI|nr:hypothetical protein OC845_004007 [Tilletia horrida]KAK0549663.1 hypothetical protein OC846_003968 [Tilletia horrida]KAK0564801.1 hypothetical protein OC861_004097 [Tilletia horrida]
MNINAEAYDLLLKGLYLIQSLSDPAGLHAEQSEADSIPPIPKVLIDVGSSKDADSGSTTPQAPALVSILRRRKDDNISSARAVVVEEASEEESSPARIEFFAPAQDYYWMTSSAPYSVVLDDVKYPTAEHCFQSLKFPHNPAVARKVRKASTPSDAVLTARRHTADVQRGWRRDGLNLVAMRQVMLLKFSQHTALRKALLSTGSARLVYAAPTDVFWGLGGRAGRNEFGKALMDVREALRNIDRLGAGSGALTI